MMTILIVLVAILSVVGSVAWVRPSKRDVKLATWRQAARVAGLQVKLEALKAEPKDSGIREDVGLASYFLYLPKAQKNDEMTWAVVKAEGWLKAHLPSGWSWYRREVALNTNKLQALIESCPVPIHAIERTPNGSRIVWDEAGQDFEAHKLVEFLTQVQAIS